ncbi:MAG TPA: phosphoenolpyruvate--protein phosphotransferase [Rhabdochlamydiaceae bacterium]|nr:phosphoenolpyruvate--protein phosphotransferase [Rhabdochlamydiaceae bacterium]
MSLNEFLLEGESVSEGIAIGIAFFWPLSTEEEVPEFPITIGEVDTEISRYRRALFSSKEDLRLLQKNLETEEAPEAITLIDTHIQMLDDPLITTHVEDKIRVMLQNTESVFRSVIKDYEKQFFEQNTDSFFHERYVDVLDISKRILGHLGNRPELNFDIPSGAVVFARELTPSHTAAATCSKSLGFVTHKGGGNSHSALIARAKGLPFVSNIMLPNVEEVQGKCVIVNGFTGQVIINPDETTLKAHRTLRKQYLTRDKKFKEENNLPPETEDGFSVHLFSNVGNVEELEEFPYATSGIGLFRSEYLFLQNGSFFPSEEQQYLAYKQLVEKAKDFPIVIRVFDIGGDKNPEFFVGQEKESNPVLGCRGIRFLLKNKPFFKTQLRALFRIALEGEIHILLPLISDLEEVKESKRLIKEVKQELTREGIAFKKKIPLGCMIEVPSAVMICEEIAAQCDFLSLGTNDLVQYTLGVDRSNPAMNHLCYPAHPSVLRMIKMVVVAAERQQIPLAICGEMASNPLFTPLLLGLGLKEFSCALRYIPMIKRTIRKCNMVKVYALAERALQLHDSAEIAQLLKDFND